MVDKAAELGTGRTGGRDATTGVIPGRFALSVGMPDSTPPKEWKWTPLSSIAQLESGHTPSRKHLEYWNGDIPWIGIKDATENHGRTIQDTYQHVTELGLENSSARLLPANTVCLSRTASVGFVVVMGCPMATSQDFVNWVCGPNIDATFLKYVLLAENEALWRFASGTTHQTIYYPEAKAFHVCLPPVTEQKAIAYNLGMLDDKIELNRRMNTTLETMAQALFQSWFVDFDPVRAKLDGRTPPGLDPATAALFPDSFQDSEIGNIPQDWEVIPLYNTAKFVNGAAFRSEDFCTPGEGRPVVKIAELKDGISTQTKWSQRHADPDQLIDTGDLLYSWSGSPDTSLDAFLWTKGSGLLNQHIFKVIAPTVAQKRFVYYLLKYLRPVLVETARNKQTTGLGHVTVADMKRLRVCWPNKEVLSAFDRIVGPIFDRAFANTVESQTLATLRDTLLPKLLSGELRVAPIAQDATNIVSFPAQPSHKPIKKTTDEFVEAVVIAQLVRKIATPEYPLGRMRYNKLAYLAHRRADEDVSQQYLKKAAGPYSPWAKYGGPEKIAEKNGYVKQTKTGVYSGLISGDHIDKIDQYLPNYPVCAAIDWVVDKFRFRKKDDLELLATVDFAALDLLRDGQSVTREAIKHIIAANKEWAPKLDRAVFSDESVDRALAELAGLFPATYQK